MFSNDLLLVLAIICDVYNYADDNSILCEGENVEAVSTNIMQVANTMLKWFKDNYLQANPSKFQLIVFDKSDELRNITLNDVVLPSQVCVKLLGVNIDNKLNFKNHVSQICKKAGRQLNVLARLSSWLDTETKLLLMNTFILSHFNFCSLVWYFCSREDLKKIEKIQKRSLRFVYNDFTSSYSELLCRSNRPLLYTERQKQLLTQTYKSINNIGPMYLHDMFTKKECNHSLRNECPLELPKFKSVKYGKNSIKYEGAKLWNSLSNNVKHSESLTVFKSNIKSWSGNECSCSVCTQCVLMNV